MTLFIRLIIRTFQLVFSAEIGFFSQTNQPTVFFSRLISTAEWGLCIDREHEHKNITT
jgi:hypothetical protein